MKHILFSAIIGLTSIPAFCAGMDSPFSKSNNPFYNGRCSEITLCGKTYNLRQAPMAHATRANQENTVIREAEGENRMYSKYSVGTTLFGNDVILYYETFPADIVWGENNEVFVKNIFSTIAFESYIKGVVEGDVITFPTGQLVEFIEDEEYGDYGLAVGIARKEIQGDKIYFFNDPSITSFSMKLNSDGGLELMLPGEPFDGVEIPEYVLNLYYSDEEDVFLCVTDFCQIYTPEDLTEITMPEGVEPETYIFIDEYDFASVINVAYTPDYIYLQGLNPMMKESVVRARIDGNKAYIAQNEFQGVYMDLFFIFTKIVIPNPDYNEEDEESPEYILAPPNMEFTLTFDREAGIIQSDNKDIYLAFMPDEDTIDNALCFLSEFIIRYQSTLAGVPSNPTHLEFYTNWVYYYGCSSFQFYLSNYSTDGMLIDEEHLYYQVLVDGEPIIFAEEEVINLNGEPAIAYPGVVGEQRWLPYLFNNFYDVNKFTNNSFDVGIYVEGFETLGVQSLYIYDNVATLSDIVTLNIITGEVTITTGVDAIEDSLDIRSVEYFDLNGIKTLHPSNGIFIKKITLSDGTVRTLKQVVR